MTNHAWLLGMSWLGCNPSTPEPSPAEAPPAAPVPEAPAPEAPAAAPEAPAPASEAPAPAPEAPAPPADAQPGSDAPDAPRAHLWQASDSLGSGWDDTWLLFSDGRFEWHVGQGVCSKDYVRVRSGRYELTDDTLVVYEERRETVTGTALEAVASSCILEGEKVTEIVHPEPVVEKLPLTPCPREKVLIHECRMFGDVAYYLFASGTDEEVRHRYAN